MQKKLKKNPLIPEDLEKTEKMDDNRNEAQGDSVQNHGCIFHIYEQIAETQSGWIVRIKTKSEL